MNGIENIAGLLLLAIVVAWLVFVFIFVAESAANKGRSTTGWCVLSLFVSPVVLILLHLLGETREFYRERLTQEELMRLELHCKIAKAADPDEEIEELIRASVARCKNLC
jgi:hypothetical protein